MEKQKEMKVAKVDILEEIKDLDKKIRAKIVYDKLADIKDWARQIAELKQKTQMLLEELGVESEDIKRLIDYATNSPEAQLSKDDLADLKDEVKDMVDDSKTKIRKHMNDATIPYAFVMSAGNGNTMPAVNTLNTNTSSGSYTVSSTAGAATVWTSSNKDGSTSYDFAGGTGDVSFKLK